MGNKNKYKKLDRRKVRKLRQEIRLTATAITTTFYKDDIHLVKEGAELNELQLQLGGRMPPTDQLRRVRCLQRYDDWPIDPDIIYCNTTFDGYLCWPPTQAGQSAQQHCPDVRLSDATQLAYRRCGDDGLWVGRHPNETSPNGWTNYTPCFPPLVQSLFYKVYDDENDAQAKFGIALSTRHLELIGYMFSFVTVLISIAIFLSFRALRNKRTLIHINLFLATILENFIRILLYIDQEIARRYPNLKIGIENMPYLCEFFYILLEYSQSSKFTWMLIEGLFLNNMVDDGAMRPSNVKLISYVIAGWGFPAITTAVWATSTAYQYRDQSSTCWYGYNFSLSYFWAQGPRWAIMACNFILLIKIMRVVVKKLKTSTNSDLEKVKKGVRAALILLPLLGLTNMFNMIQIPVDTNIHLFAIWCYLTHFLRSFQGFFISIIYCFMNAEVRHLLGKKWANTKIMGRYRGEHPEALELFKTPLGTRFFRRTRGNGNRPMSSDCNPTASTTNNVVSGAEVENFFRQDQPQRRRLTFAANPTVHTFEVSNEREERPRNNGTLALSPTGNEVHPLARNRLENIEQPQKSVLNVVTVEVHPRVRFAVNAPNNPPQQRSDLNAPEAPAVEALAVEAPAIEALAPVASCSQTNRNDNTEEPRPLKSSDIDIHPNARYAVKNKPMRKSRQEKRKQREEKERAQKEDLDAVKVRRSARPL